MRKPLAIALILASLTVSSCATFNKGYLKSVKNVALVTVMCDKRVDTREFKGLANLISEFAQSDKFQLQPVCQEIKNNIFTKNASKFPFLLIPENQIITSSGYKTLKESFPNQLTDFLHYEVPEGYTSVAYTNDADLEKIFSKLPQADGTMVVEASFLLHKGLELYGFGSATVRTALTVVVKNRQNQDVIKVVLYGKSQHDIKYALGGVFDAADVQPLCLEAVQDALFQFDKWVQYHI